MDKKELYKENLLREYRSMFRALCRMTSYYEKLTTDGFVLNDEDKTFINTVIDKTENHFIKRINNWVSKGRLK